MKKGLITIVLPIYNVEKYLNRCIESIVNQTYKELEIILVDDGSPDKCPQICDKWEKKDSRIKVIHKKNEGLGMARNTGIDNATGEYICFFDSDDYVNLDTIEKTYKLASNNNAEIITFGFSEIDASGNLKKKIIPKAQKNIYEGIEIKEKFLPDLIATNPKTGKKTNLWMSAWCSLYSVELIKRNNWKFVSEREIISEDVYSLLYLYDSVKKVAILSESLYNYCENDTSLTHTYKKDRYEKIKYFYNMCINKAEELNYNKEIKERLMYPYIANTIAALKMIIKADCKMKEKKNEFNKIISDNHLQSILKKMDIRKESLQRKILFIAMKYKIYNLCFFLIKIKV